MLGQIEIGNLGLTGRKPMFDALRRLAGLALMIFGATALAQTSAQAESVLRVVMVTDVKVLDPIWTPYYGTRNHGYMIYDTLFAMNDRYEITPQMAERYEVSADRLTWDFTLREGLLFHDGTPVTSEDVIASLKRWGNRDVLGRRLFAATRELVKIDDRRFRLVLASSYALVLEALGKPSSNVPFIMPKRIADTPATQQISDSIGSGPFVFRKDQWKPGEKAIYVRNDRYKSRAEPTSWAAGGKVVKVDRVEWLAMPDPQTAVHALQTGEIDYLHQPRHDLLPLLEADKGIVLLDNDPLGNQFVMRLNHQQPPFNNQKLRQAVVAAMSQKEILEAAVGNPAYYKTCTSLLMCGTPYASEKGMSSVSDVAKAKRLLGEAGYDGTPIIFLRATDSIVSNAALVAADLMRKVGFVVDVQSMDFQTLIARREKRDPPGQGGWSVFVIAPGGIDHLDPVNHPGIDASCKGFIGWPCDEEVERLRSAFERETDLAKRRELAEQAQVRAIEVVVQIPLGQWYERIAYRRGVLDGVPTGPVPFFWGIGKQGR
jgi:peptide/nickel transport system substrate-binding protein